MKNIEAKILKNENDKMKNEKKNTVKVNESINFYLNKIFCKSKNGLLLKLIIKN